MLVRILLIIALCFIYTQEGLAQSKNKSSSDQVDIEVLVGEYTKEKLVLGISYKLKPGWKMNWKNPGDAGFPPQIDWTRSKNIGDVRVLWPFPKRSISNFSDLSLESYIYQDEVLFPIYITPELSSKEIDLDFDINFGVCKELCIPIDASLKQLVQTGYTDKTSYEKINNSYKYIPKENGSNGLSINNFFVKKIEDKQFLHVLTETKNNAFKNYDLFIEGGDKFAFYSPEVALSDNNTKAEFVYEITFLTKDNNFDKVALEFVLVNRGQSVVLNEKFHKTTDSYFLETKPANNVNAALSLMLLFAFIGGLILNIMPCVLPVLSIKLLNVIKYSGKGKGNISINFAASSVGIVFSFLVLGSIIVFLKNTGANIGWGFHFQEPVFLIFLVVILTLFAANLWGLFNIHIPESLGVVLSRTHHLEGIYGSFLTGVLATILATPCTAPF